MYTQLPIRPHSDGEGAVSPPTSGQIRSVSPQAEQVLRQLIDRIAHRDRMAFGALHAGMVTAVRNLARHLVPDARYANQITQATFIELWYLAGPGYPGADGVCEWADAVARRRCADHHSYLTVSASRRHSAARVKAFYVAHTKRVLTTLLEPHAGARRRSRPLVIFQAAEAPGFTI